MLLPVAIHADCPILILPPVTNPDPLSISGTSVENDDHSIMN